MGVVSIGVLVGVGEDDVSSVLAIAVHNGWYWRGWYILDGVGESGVSWVLKASACKGEG